MNDYSQFDGKLITDLLDATMTPSLNKFPSKYVFSMFNKEDSAAIADFLNVLSNIVLEIINFESSN